MAVVPTAVHAQSFQTSEETDATQSASGGGILHVVHLRARAEIPFCKLANVHAYDAASDVLPARVRVAGATRIA